MSDKPHSRYTGPGSALPRPEDKLRPVPMADMDPDLRRMTRITLRQTCDPVG